MMGALSLRGFALAHLGRHVLTHTHAHTESALSHVGPIDLSGQSLLRVIMQFNSGGKSISLLWDSLIRRKEISDVMLPVRNVC